jgi:type IV secretory pathway TrbD component
MGAERDLALFTLFIGGLLMFIGMTWYTFFVSLVFTIGVMIGLQKMFKADQQMFAVFKKHVKYRSFYSAQAHPIYDKKG